MNVDAKPTNLTEIEFRAHPVGKEFVETCEQLGIDLSKWEYSYCEHDTDPYEYYDNKPPWRHGHVLYRHPDFHDHSLWSDFNDDNGGWGLDSIEMTQD